MIRIEIANSQRLLKLDRKRLRAAARGVLAAHGVLSAEISIAVVDDETIHGLNRRFLNHDYATDVLSFVLDRQNGHLDGEVVASAETAARVGRKRAANAQEELLLYIVHGMLHLVGFDDQTADEARRMRKEERRILALHNSNAAAATLSTKRSRAARAKPARNHG